MAAAMAQQLGLAALKAAISGHASGGGDLTSLHVAIMQYDADAPARATARTLAELVELAQHTARAFASAARAAQQPGRRASPAAAELLDLLPTIAKVTSAVGGPAYDGAVTAEVVRLATGEHNWEPPTVLPVLNLFAELPGVLTDGQAADLCDELLGALGAIPPEDVPGMCKALVNLVTKHPQSTVWPSTFRSVLAGAPSAALPTTFCMVDLALQHAPASGATLLASFQADAVQESVDVPDVMLLLILSQTHAYKEQAFSLLTTGFAIEQAAAEPRGPRGEGGSGSDDEGGAADGEGGEDGGAAVAPEPLEQHRRSVISATVQAVTASDARLARVLTELGLHWCDAAGTSRRVASLRSTGRHLLAEVFKEHPAARREVLSVAFSAVVEEPSPQVKASYCSLIESLLADHRALMGDHTAVLHAWMSSIQTLTFPLQKRILDAVLHVAVVNGPLTSHISMCAHTQPASDARGSRGVADRLLACTGQCAS